MLPLLSSCLASDMQHWAARNNIIASFSFCSKCRFWECDSTLLGYQTLRASAAFVWSSPTSDCRTQDRNNWLPLVFPPFWWCEMTSAARKSLQLQSGALKKPKSTPSLSRRNIPAWWWCVEEKKKPTTPSSAGRMRTKSEAGDWLPAQVTANAGWYNLFPPHWAVGSQQLHNRSSQQQHCKATADTWGSLGRVGAAHQEAEQSG